MRFGPERGDHLLQVSRTTLAPKLLAPNCSGKSQFTLAHVGATAWAAPAFAADDNADTTTERGSSSLLFENDTFSIPTARTRMARATGSGEVHARHELGQVIFTPETLDVSNPPLNQRRYAGFLWLGLPVLTNNDQRLNRVEMQLGHRPRNAAGNAQIFIRAVLGTSRPLGRDYHAR